MDRSMSSYYEGDDDISFIDLPGPSSSTYVQPSSSSSRKRLVPFGNESSSSSQSRKAFALFIEHRKAEQTLISRNNTHLGEEFNKECEDLWKNLGDDEKNLFYAMANEDQDIFSPEIDNGYMSPPHFPPFSAPAPLCPPPFATPQFSAPPPLCPPPFPASPFSAPQPLFPPSFSSTATQFTSTFPSSLPSYTSKPLPQLPVAPAEKKRKVEPQKDPSFPKGPTSAFLYFCGDQRAVVRAEHPEMKADEISKELGRRWGLMNVMSDRQKYQVLAENDKIRYQQEIAKYNQQKLLNKTVNNNQYPSSSSTSASSYYGSPNMDNPFPLFSGFPASSTPLFGSMGSFWSNGPLDYLFDQQIDHTKTTKTDLNSNVDEEDDEDVEMVDWNADDAKPEAPLISPYDIVFEKFQFLNAAPSSHKFKDQNFVADNEHEFLQAYQREIKILGELPNGIFVAGFEDRMDLFSALIIGPEGTPYEGGLFSFDIMLPSSFPRKPPVFHFLCFSHDRMNPNLYVDGKVCVSILGTWAGRNATEKWSAKDSSLLQVLVSIQGLILVAQPYFNEPGLEFTMGTKGGTLAARRYNEKVIQLMLESMAGQLARPPAPFEFEITYVLKNECPRIIQRVESWLKGKKENPPKFPLLPFQKHASNFPSLIENLKKAHAKYVKM